MRLITGTSRFFKGFSSLCTSILLRSLRLRIIGKKVIIQNNHAKASHASMIPIFVITPAPSRNTETDESNTSFTFRENKDSCNHPCGNFCG